MVWIFLVAAGQPSQGVAELTGRVLVELILLWSRYGCGVSCHILSVIQVVIAQRDFLQSALGDL